MVPELILLAIVIGWLLGGRLLRVADVRINQVWLIFVPLVIYFATRQFLLSPVQVGYPWVAPAAHLLEKAIMLAVVLLNLRLPGAKIILAGMILNLFAIVANGGTMPVLSSALKHVFGADYLTLARSVPLVHASISDGKSPLWFLCDVFPLHRPYALVPGVYSFGDMVMSVGIMVTLIKLMRAPGKPGQDAGEEA